MYPMNEEPPRSPVRVVQRGPIIQKETSYVVTERIQIINPNVPATQQPSLIDRITQGLPDDQATQQSSLTDRIKQSSLTDRIKQALPVDKARNSFQSLREHIHLPHLSKEMRRWFPVISSVLLAVLLISLKSHFSPNDSALSRSRFGSDSHSTKLGDYGWDRAAVHDKVHDALHGAKSRVKDNLHDLDSYMEHYRHYPDQNWMKSEPEHELTSEERAAQLIEDLHEQARRLHIQDPTEVQYEPLTQEELDSLRRTSRRSHHTSHQASRNAPAQHGESESVVSKESDVDEPIHNATEYHRAQRLVHLSRDLRNRAESVPHRLMRNVHSIREEFVNRMEQIHDLIMKQRAAPVEEKAAVETRKSGPSYHERYHERTQQLIQELEDLSHRIADSAHLHTPVVKKTPWYMRPVQFVTESRPLEWAEDQYHWVVSKTFGLSEEARHRAAQAEEEVRHEAAHLQELMKHELRLLKMEVDRVPGKMKKATKNMKSMPLDMLEHFA